MDSEPKIEGKPGETPVKPEKTEEIIVRDGAPVKIVRGKSGQFQRQPKAMPSGREFTRVTRNYMLNMEADKDGKITKGSQTKYEMMVENIICISRGVPTVLKNGDTIEREPKQDMASAQAFKILTERGLGKVSTSDEDREAAQTDPIRIVIMSIPNLMNKDVIEDKPKLALKPAFAEVTEITTNPKV